MSRIDESDKMLARRTSRAAIGIIQDELESCVYRLEDIIELLESTCPEDEIKDDDPGPVEYSAAASLKDRIMRAVRHADNLLNK